jgi:hypothetical protein
MAGKEIPSNWHRPKGTPKTGGRVKGTPNKTTAELKNMVMMALDKAGGVDYLLKQARDNPTAFLSLVKSLLPKDVNVGGQEDNKLVVTILGWNKGQEYTINGD